jgi:hypothetical protein
MPYIRAIPSHAHAMPCLPSINTLQLQPKNFPPVSLLLSSLSFLEARRQGSPLRPISFSLFSDLPNALSLSLSHYHSPYTQPLIRKWERDSTRRRGPSLQLGPRLPSALSRILSLLPQPHSLSQGSLAYPHSKLNPSTRYILISIHIHRYLLLLMTMTQ